MLTPKEVITALFAVSIALVWSAWALVCEWIERSSTAQRWAIVVGSVLLFCAALWCGVVPVVRQYGNLLLN